MFIAMDDQRFFICIGEHLSVSRHLCSGDWGLAKVTLGSTFRKVLSSGGE